MTPVSRPSAAPRSLRVLVADADPAAHAVYREALTALGHQVCPAETGKQLLALCKAATPDLVITADRLPDADGFELAAALCRESPLPVVLASAAPDPAAAWAAAGCHVLAYLAKPLRPDAVGAAVALAVRGFEHLRALRAEAAELRQALEDRKLIERAKGAVGRYCGLPEDEAYRRLRALATNGGRKLVEVARDVLGAADVFASLAESGATSRGPRHGGPRANGHAMAVQEER
jgi:AmiR/NasT family two-component response regulator